ncbi:MAG: hypothetical protein AAGJ56_01865 [Myxococcota bacterium]
MAFTRIDRDRARALGVSIEHGQVSTASADETEVAAADTFAESGRAVAPDASVGSRPLEGLAPGGTPRIHASVPAVSKSEAASLSLLPSVLVDPVERERLAEALAFRPETVLGLRHLGQGLTSAFVAAEPGSPAAVRIADLRSLYERSVDHHAAGRHSEAAQVVLELREELDVAAGLDGAALASPAFRFADNAIERITSSVPPVRSVAPPSTVELAGRLYRAYSDHAVTALNAIDASFVELYDGWGVSGRVRGADASFMTTKMQIALWTVARDLRAGAVTPQEFGVNDWQEVDAYHMQALATERLDSIASGEGFSATSEAMLRDPLWIQEPVEVRSGDELVLLTYENFSEIGLGLGLQGERIFGDTITTRRFLDSPLMAELAESAQAVADGTATDAEAFIAVAHRLWRGSEDMPASNAQTLAALSRALGIPLAHGFRSAEAGLNAGDLRDEVAEGTLGGFLETADGFVVYDVKSPTEFALEFQQLLDRGALGALSSESQAKLSEILADEGRELQARLEEEGDSRYWRELGAEVVLLGTIGVASMGTGAVLEALAIGGRTALGVTTSGRVARVAHFVGQSAGFTTMLGVAEGEIDPLRYPLDAAMFGAMRLTAPVSGLAGSLLGRGSRFARVGAAVTGYSVSTATAATTMTGFQGVEAWARGNPMTARELGEALEHSVMVVGILHGVNAGVGRLAPYLAEGAQIRRQLSALQTRVDAAIVQQRGAQLEIAERSRRFEDLSARALEARTRAELEPRDATLAERSRALNVEMQARQSELTDAVQRYNQEYRPRVDALRTELLALTGAAAPALLPAVTARVGEANFQVSGATSLLPSATALQVTMAERFSNVRNSLKLDDVLSRDVTGVSSESLAAYMDTARSPFGSAQPSNVSHLASVLANNVRSWASENGRPVDQATLDRLFRDTVLTDAFYKDVSGLVLENAPTAPTQAGATGGEIRAHMRRTALEHIFDGGPYSAEVRGLREQWRRSGIPDEPGQAIAEAARAAAQARGLSGRDREAYVESFVVEGRTMLDRLDTPPSPEARTVFERWLVEDRLPMNVDAVEAQTREILGGRPQAVQDAAVKEVTRLWGERVMSTFSFLNVQGFGLGVWIHGIPSYGLVEGVVRSIPSRSPSGETPASLAARARETYETVLTHHMADFIAAGFARGRLEVQFYQLEAAGHLPSGAACRLTALYDTSINLSAKWRGPVNRGLTEADRVAYYAEAAPLRGAIEGLRPEARRQLFGDDAGQFTPLRAIPKWFEMQQSAPTNAAALEGMLRGAVMPYLESARVRDPNPDPSARGREFIEASRPALEALGATYDTVSGVFRPARSGEPAARALASRVAGDPMLRTRLENALGPIERLSVDQVIQWFRTQPFELSVYARLSFGDAPTYGGFARE